MTSRIKLTSLFFVAMIISLTYANWPAAALPPDVQADRILVEKGKRQMRLFREGRLLKVYDVSLGGEPVGHKVQEGDQRTPEGIYQIDFKKSDSAFHLALHISYPGPQNIRNTNQKGVSPGGVIMIRGVRNGFGWLGRLHLLFDSTTAPPPASGRSPSSPPKANEASREKAGQTVPPEKVISTQQERPTGKQTDEPFVY